MENTSASNAFSAFPQISTPLEVRSTSSETDSIKLADPVPTTMLNQLHNVEDLGPSTKSIIDEAERRGIPWQRVNQWSKILFGYGKNQKLIQATITGNTPCLAVETADSKIETKEMLEAAGIPVPNGGVCTTVQEMHSLISKIGYPVVIKPGNANHGRGVSTNITTPDEAADAFAHAETCCKEVMVEKHIPGHDHRMLVINGRLVAASRRIRASVTGDGKATISELVDEINSMPERGDGHDTELTNITLDADTLKQLQNIGYTKDTVPAAGETVILKSTANLSTGGTAEDVTDEVHPANRFLAERVAALVGLDICGIDIVSPDLSNPIAKNCGAVIEVNAAPGFRMHLTPSQGKPRNVAKAVIDMLYPPGIESRIPIFAVTGTNGKTTTTRLLAHIVKTYGHYPGYTTTDGVYIGDHQIISGDCSGPSSASVVLRDPLVDFAVLETARGGLLRAGLAFDRCDVGILTNIQADHLGLKNINTLEDLAEVKAAVVRSVKPTGWAVLNAEDPHCVRISKTLTCNVALFSLDRNNAVLDEHIKNGGLAASLENNVVVIRYGEISATLARTDEIPLTLGGMSKCMTANILAATAAAFGYGFTPTEIRRALLSFIPGTELTPGRMNLFEVNDFKVLVDYAHNPHGMLALQDYLGHIEAPRKVGIIAGVGDRRDRDIIELAEIAANIFDHIIVRQEHSLRGRTLEEINGLMVQGIKRASRAVSYDLVPDESQAIRHALAMAQPGDYIVALSDNYPEVIQIIREHQRSDSGYNAPKQAAESKTQPFR